MRDSKKLFKGLGLIGIGLCAACCLLPIIGVMFGMGALTFLTGLLEWAGIISMIGAVICLAIFFVKSRKPHACDIDCTCKHKAHSSTGD